ncbi:MAG: hypothetical protein R3D71_10030 [Rickettsiales bacterium]
MVSVTDNWIGITKIIGVVLAKNEVGNDSINNEEPYKLSYAGGNSGYSFGWNQLDLSKNSKAIDHLTNILTNAIDPNTGNLVVDDINTFLANYRNALITHGILPNSVITQIELALSSAYGKTYLASLFEQTTLENINYVLSELYKAGEKYVSAALEDPKILIQLTDYHNQFNISIGGKMEQFLQGKSVTLTGGTVQISGDLDIDDIRNFITSTEWATSGHMDDINRRFGNIDDTVTQNIPIDLVDKTIGGSNSSFNLLGAVGSANITFGGSGNDKLYGSYQSDVLSGGSGNDELSGNDGDDRLFGHSGNDLLIGGKGNDILDGGEDASKLDIDTISYEDRLFGVDVKITERGDNEVVNPSLIISRENDIILNIEKINFTSQNDTVEIRLLASTQLQEIHTGAGDDTVTITGSATAFKPVIYLEDGNDVLVSAPRGSIVYGGAGENHYEAGMDYIIADADADDHIYYGARPIHGGVSFNTQESPWAKGLYGVRYGRNEDDELVIVTPDGRQTFIANFNFDLAGERTAGLLVGEGTLEFHRLLESPKGFNLYGTFETIFGYYMKAIFGISFFPGIDPLILDMDGDGVELNARLGVSPFYDIDADGFAEQTGWARGDDAFLVRDLNANGIIDDVSEMFGDVTTSGFDALRVLDSNNDGVINAADNEFSTLLLWQDVNENTLTDAGELTSLNAANDNYVDISVNIAIAS